MPKEVLRGRFSPTANDAEQDLSGVEWQNYRQRYEDIVAKLHAKYPVHFLAIGRHSGQAVEDLFGSIKRAIASSTEAVFDASRGNANVSLKFGYAEACGIKCYLMIDSVTLPTRSAQGTPIIISDLAGSRIDVYDVEPLPQDHPGRRVEPLIATPHIGYVSRGLYERFYRDSVNNISTWLDDRKAG